MTVRESINLFNYYLQANHRRRTIASYRYLLGRFDAAYAARMVDSIASEEILQFMEGLTRSMAKSTRRLRYAQLKAFYNFITERCSFNAKNPCSAPLLSKSFRMPRQVSRKILDKETVDEMIYNTDRPRDRLILELQARCGLRIGELLNIKVSDADDHFKIFTCLPGFNIGDHVQPATGEQSM